MNDIKDMTNDEFISHLMTGYNKHGALVQMVILDCLGNVVSMSTLKTRT